MVVLSGLDYKNYLKGEESMFNNFKNLDVEDQKNWRGDFDILIIHKIYGLIEIEVKAVGIYKEMEESKLYKAIIKRIKKAVDQLQKVRKFFVH